MAKILINENPIDVIGEPLFRGVFDPCDGSNTAQIEMQIVSSDGAHSIWVDFPFSDDTWTTEQAKKHGFDQINKMLFT